MRLKINKVLLAICIIFFFTKCENELVNVSSENISTILEFSNFDLNFNESQSYNSNNLDSLISLSPRLYAFSTNFGDNSQIFLDLDISKIHDSDPCLSDSISLIKLELSSLNQLVEKSLGEEGEINESISDIYIDTNGVEIFGNNIPLNFKFDEYDIIIDSLDNQIDDFCLLDNIEFAISYDNSLNDPDVSTYLEIFSSDYTFEPSQPKLQIEYNNLEEQTVTSDKYDLESINSDEDFNVYILGNSESDNRGKVYLVNYENDNELGYIDSIIMINEINIENPIVSSVPSEFNVDLYFSIDDELSNLDSFFPIQIYLDNFIGYSDDSDPQGDNWLDCGTDGICSDSNPDDDGTEGNGIWDIGEAYDQNHIFDWIDANENGFYDYGEVFIELYNDSGFDGCFDEYEDGNGGCLEESNTLYNPYGTEQNQLYNSGEIFDDFGEDGCFDEYEDGNGGCLDVENPNYDEELNSDPNGDNYNVDPSSDNWLDFGEDGCFDEYEDGNGGCLDDENANYDEELDSDPNGDNYDYLNNPNGSELNAIWDQGEGTESNGQYDFGEVFFDVGSDGLLSDFEVYPDNDLFTEGNGIWDIGEPYEDYGQDGIINYLEEGYNLNGTEGNNVYNQSELIVNDFGEDGCFDEYEDGNGGCLDVENPDYDEELNSDPNGDNYLEDINQDNWNDCGTDGICSDSNPDDDGTEGNLIWDLGENFELNNQMDWVDTNLNSLIDNEDESYEVWYDDGADNINDSVEFLQVSNLLSSNVINDINSYIDFNGEDLVANYEIDDSKDINIWISSILHNIEENNYKATINFKVNAPTKAIEFDFLHLPDISLDSVYVESNSLFYGSYEDTLISDRSEYSYHILSDVDIGDIILDYSSGIETNLYFDFLSEFINQDSTVSVSNEYSNLYLYLDNREDFNEGFSDIYYKGIDSDIFLKRVYFDDNSLIEIPIGNLIQKFIDKTLVYNGINLKLSGGGYNFNRLNFHKYGDDNWDSCGYVGCSDSLNPKIEIMYVR